MSEYDPILMAADATEFADSRFGEHYLGRLEELKAGYLDKTMDRTLSDNERAHYGTRAAEIDGELKYFQVAKQITLSKKLRSRMRQSISKKEEGAKQV